jgi:hypothetical protein
MYANESDDVSQRQHLLGCADALRRRRQITAWTRPGATKVVVRVPPGEVAVLSADQARAFSSRLNHLADVLDRPGGDLPPLAEPGL